MLKNIKSTMIGLLLLAAAPLAQAATVISTGDLVIGAADTLQVPLNLSSDLTDIYCVEATVNLPAGMSFVRMDNGKFITPDAENTNDAFGELNNSTGKFVVINMSQVAFKDANGLLANILVTANRQLAKNTTISFQDVKVKRTNGETVDVTAQPVKVTRDDWVNKVQLYLDKESAKVEPGKSVSFQVMMENTSTFAGLQARLVLPAAVTATVTATDRTKELSYNAENGNIIINPSDAFTGHEGAIFTVTLATTEALAEQSVVKIENIILSSAASVAVKQQTLSYTIIKKDPTPKNELLAKADELTKKLAEAQKTIEEKCADVKDNFISQVPALQERIETLKKQVVADFDADTLDKAARDAEADAIGKDIDKLLTEAQAAQKAYDEEQAKKAANEAAYKTLTAQIDALQAELDAAKDSINTVYSAVASNFVDRIAAIQQQIDALREALKKQYDAVELTADSKVDGTAVKQAIAKLMEDVKKAFLENGIAAPMMGVEGATYYDQNGRQVLSPKRGQVVIMKTADGKARKVLVK